MIAFRRGQSDIPDSLINILKSRDVRQVHAQELWVPGFYCWDKGQIQMINVWPNLSQTFAHVFYYTQTLNKWSNLSYVKKPWHQISD